MQAPSFDFYLYQQIISLGHKVQMAQTVKTRGLRVEPRQSRHVALLHTHCQMQIYDDDEDDDVHVEKDDGDDEDDVEDDDCDASLRPPAGSFAIPV